MITYVDLPGSQLMQFSTRNMDCRENHLKQQIVSRLVFTVGNSHISSKCFYIPMFDIPYDSFKKEIPKIEEMMIRLRKRNRQNRIELTEGFSLKSWEAMPSDKKINHTYYNCMSCQNEPSLKMLIGLFPKKKMDV